MSWGKVRADGWTKAESSPAACASLFNPNGFRYQGLGKCREAQGGGRHHEASKERVGVVCERVGGGCWRKGHVLIVDGSGADSCNDLICLCAWRWKERAPLERRAPSFSVNRVNYLHNEICKVVNLGSSLLFLHLRSFVFFCTLEVLSSFPSVRPTHLIHQLTPLAPLFL